MLTIKEELEKVYGFYVSEETDVADLFRILEVSGKVTMKTLIDTCIIALKHIEELEKNAKNTTTSPIQSPKR